MTDRLHGIARGPELIHRHSHLLQVGRANVGTIGEAEINQHELATKVRIGAARAVLVDERERAADRLAVPHHHVHQLGGGTIGLLRERLTGRAEQAQQRQRHDDAQFCRHAMR